jgi:hypothetical protein
MTDMSRAGRARISWTLDLASAAAGVLLLCAWLSDLRTLSAHGQPLDGQQQPPTYLSPSFLSEGFCNSRTADTQWLCTCLDAAGGLLFLLMCATLSPQACLPLAGYLFAHSYGHYDIMMRDETAPDEMMWPSNIAAVSAILFIGPAKSALDSISVDVASPAVAWSCALAVEGCIVYVWVVHIRKVYYGLLYINITIILCIMLTRVCLVGYTAQSHISKRIDMRAFTLKHSTVSIAILSAKQPFYCRHD